MPIDKNTSFYIDNVKVADDERSIALAFDQLSNLYDNICIKNDETKYSFEIDNSSKTIFKEKNSSDKKATTTINPRQITGKYTIVSYQNWEGKILSVQKNSFKAQLVDTRGNYSSRLVDINKNIINDSAQEFDIKEGICFYWNFKEIRTNKGQVKKINSFEIYSNLKKPQFEIEEQIEKEMQKLSFLFEDDE